VVLHELRRSLLCFHLTILLVGMFTQPLHHSMARQLWLVGTQYRSTHHSAWYRVDPRRLRHAAVGEVGAEVDHTRLRSTCGRSNCCLPVYGLSGQVLVVQLPRFCHRKWRSDADLHQLQVSFRTISTFAR
jgi:hypothetical protein